MSHKLTSNSSVVYNAETQASGTLEIHAEQIIYQDDTSGYHNVMLSLPIKVSGSNTYAGGLTYNLTPENWNTFFSSQTLVSTNEYDKQAEASLNYAKSQIDGRWGLTSSDWTYSNS